MKVIPESDMRFGYFEEMNLFHIENSQLYEKMGSGIKTVEFILRYNKNSIIFLEAKKSCPNSSFRGIQIKCVLVIKNADERWLPGVMAELKERLKTYRKIWGIEVAVLNEELAGKYKLTC